MTYPKLEPRAFQPQQQLNLGDFTISRLLNGKIWISYKTGEGGEFSAEDLEAVVYEYFWENF